MRLLTLDENGYGVGLFQRRFIGDADESTMATIDDVASKNNLPEEGSMVSNLPLLFANGYPTSLEKITLEQLERFVTFMVQCSLGHDTAEVILQPQWWPKEVKFSNPLSRPRKVNETWMANLKKLVFRCYTYHRSEYLLRFCSYLARYPHNDLEYVNNWDSTTSLYHKATGKLLVTFRNENMNYDRRNESPRKKLLSHNGVGSSYSNKSKQQQSLIMVEPPIEDIYLCDNCDAEFVGLEKMKEHEQKCCEQEPATGNSRSTTPDTLTGEPELRQNQFFEYFRLRSSTEQKKSPEPSNGIVENNNVIRRTSHRVRGSVAFTRCPTIPFSSPAGLLLAKKSKTMTEETQQERLERIERHVIAPPLNNFTCRPKWLDSEGEGDRDRWTVTHKPNRDKSESGYVYQYRFVNSARRKPMLSIRSQLLCIVCRPVYVVLTRLNEEHIDELKQELAEYQYPVRKISVKKKDWTGVTNQENVDASVSLKRKAPEDERDSDETIVEVNGNGNEDKDGNENENENGNGNENENENETEKENGNENGNGNGNENENENENADKVITENNFTETNTVALTDYKMTETLKDNTTVKTTNNEIITVCGKPSSPITFIDLCSSDDENDEDSSILVFPSADENTDPMYCQDNAKNSLLQKLQLNNFYNKSHVIPTNPTNEWLSDNILNDDGENGANGTKEYRGTVVLNAHSHFSPILRPAP